MSGLLVALIVRDEIEREGLASLNHHAIAVVAASTGWSF